MVTMAQRIEELRTERGLSRPSLAAALGLPKNAIEKFETGRQSPTKEQVQALADYFAVSVFYLRGERAATGHGRTPGWTRLTATQMPVMCPWPRPSGRSPSPRPRLRGRGRFLTPS